MNFSKLIMGLGVAALAVGTNLPAQDGNVWHAGLSVVKPLEGLKSVTNKSGLGSGFIGEVGYTGQFASTTVPFRATLAVNSFSGDTVLGVKSSLIGYQLAGDILTNTGAKNLTIVTGLSLNKWKWDYTNPDPTVIVKDKGIKFGVRLGLDYRINDHFSADALLQVTELGTDPKSSVSLNPSWLQVGVKYHF
jgi:hypothetical protein